MGMDSPVEGAKEKVDDAKDAAQKMQASRPYQLLVRGGLIAFGVMHLLIAFLAVRLTLGERDAEASQSGALRELSQNPLGPLLLGAVAVGFFVIMVWQLLSAFVGHRQFVDGKLIRKRLGSVGRAVMYGVLGFQAAQLAFAPTDSGGDAEKSLTATLLGMPLGQALVAVVGVAVIAVGGHHIFKGVRDKYNEDLEGRLSGAAKWLSRVGHVAKGVAIGIIGVLFVIAALDRDADSAGGMDEALTGLLSMPFGDIVLVVIAVGMAAYGVYCFFWAKRAKFR